MENTVNKLEPVTSDKIAIFNEWLSNANNNTFKQEFITYTAFEMYALQELSKMQISKPDITEAGILAEKIFTKSLKFDTTIPKDLDLDEKLKDVIENDHTSSINDTYVYFTLILLGHTSINDESTNDDVSILDKMYVLWSNNEDQFTDLYNAYVLSTSNFDNHMARIHNIFYEMKYGKQVQLLGGKKNKMKGGGNFMIIMMILFFLLSSSLVHGLIAKNTKVTGILNILENDLIGKMNNNGPNGSNTKLASSGAHKALAATNNALTFLDDWVPDIIKRDVSALGLAYQNPVDGKWSYHDQWASTQIVQQIIDSGILNELTDTTLQRTLITLKEILTSTKYTLESIRADITTRDDDDDKLHYAKIKKLHNSSVIGALTTLLKTLAPGKISNAILSFFQIFVERLDTNATTVKELDEQLRLMNDNIKHIEMAVKFVEWMRYLQGDIAEVKSYETAVKVIQGLFDLISGVTHGIHAVGDVVGKGITGDVLITMKNDLLDKPEDWGDDTNPYGDFTSSDIKEIINAVTPKNIKNVVTAPVHAARSVADAARRAADVVKRSADATKSAANYGKQVWERATVEPNIKATFQKFNDAYNNNNRLDMKIAYDKFNDEMKDYKDKYDETPFYKNYSEFLNIDPDKYDPKLKNSFTKGGQTKKRSKRSKKSKSRKHKKNSKRKL